MTVESYILMRTDGDGTDLFPFGPRSADLAPYTSLGWTDVTARLGTAAMQETEPRLIVIKAKMSDDDGDMMAVDDKLWMIESKRYDVNGFGEHINIQTNKQQTYTAQARDTRINQLATFTGFDADKIATWWTVDKTRREIGSKLRAYLKTLE